MRWYEVLAIVLTVLLVLAVLLYLIGYYFRRHHRKFNLIAKSNIETIGSDTDINLELKSNGRTHKPNSLRSTATTSIEGSFPKESIWSEIIQFSDYMKNGSNRSVTKARSDVSIDMNEDSYKHHIEEQKQHFKVEKDKQNLINDRIEVEIHCQEVVNTDLQNQLKARQNTFENFNKTMSSQQNLNGEHTVSPTPTSFKALIEKFETMSLSTQKTDKKSVNAFETQV